MSVTATPTNTSNHTVHSSNDTAQATNRWQGMFKDIVEEHGFRPLRIEGSLPEDLNGTYYQNGPGLFSAQGMSYDSLFDGDGLIRAVKLQQGKAQGAVKLVQSKELLAESSAGKPLYDGFGTILPGLNGMSKRIQSLSTNQSPVKNTANTNVIQWQDRLLALQEGSLPTELSPETLGTLGETTLSGVLKGAFSAHPSWVSERRCGYNFGVRAAGINTYLDIYEMPTKGGCRILNSIKLKHRCIGFIHDVAATANHLIFFIPPLEQTNKTLLQIIMGKKSFLNGAQWKDKEPTEIIVIPIDRPKEVTRFEVDPFFHVHFGNAYEAKGKLIVDYFHSKDDQIFQWLGEYHKGHSISYHQKHYDDLFNGQNQYASYHRAEINLETKKMVTRPLLQGAGEFPRIHPSLQGSKHRYSYLLNGAESSILEPNGSLFSGLVKYDHNRDEAQVVKLSDNESPMEPVFVKKKEARSEDDGYVIGMVYDRNRDRSYLSVKDALEFSSEPLAKIHFDQALPFSFHGNFVPLP